MNPLLDKLKELRYAIQGGNNAKARKLVQECVNDAQAQGEQGGEWIPCKERLPETDVQVLVHQKYDNIPYIATRLIDKRDPSRFYWWANMSDAAEIDEDARYDGHVVETYCEITHWQPLPPPPSTIGS